MAESTQAAAESPSAPELVRATRFLDSDSPEVSAFVSRVTEGAHGAVEMAVRLFYAVRDEIRYDPYGIRLEADFIPQPRNRSLDCSSCQ